jgi:hypothetical protein
MPYAFNPFTGRLDDTGNVVLDAADNEIVRSDGTGGTSTQGSGIFIDDYTTSTQGNIQLSTRSATFSCTATASDDFIAATGHTFVNGDQIQFPALTGGAGLNTTTRYFVRDAQAGVRFKVSTTAVGAAIDITSDMTAGTVNLLIAIGIAPTAGGGFYLGPKPDGTITGGNARGLGSVDLQFSRTVATQVASGRFSFIGGGSNNTATGVNAFVPGGFSCTASSTTAEASGNICTASASGSMAKGSSAIATRVNTAAWGSGQFSAAGDCQMLWGVMRCVTTNATATELFFDGSSARLTVPSGRDLHGMIFFKAIRSDGLARHRGIRVFDIKNASGTTSLNGAVQTLGTDLQDNVSTAFTIDADDTNDSLRVRFTGINGETWRVKARVDLSELVWGT